MREEDWGMTGFGNSIGCDEIDLGFMIGSQEDEHDDL